MNSNEVLAALNFIGDETSTNKKLEMLKQVIDDREFKTIVGWAYNPFKTFGLKPTAEDDVICRNSTGTEDFTRASTHGFLVMLSERKATGLTARAQFVRQLERLTPQSGELLIRILRKDLKGGFDERMINKACANMIPVFPYMRCCLPKDTDMHKWDWETGVFAQEKADGMFANGTYGSNDFVLSTRQGTPLPMDTFAELAEQATSLLVPKHQYHGELLVERDGSILPREISNGIMNSIVKGGYQFGKNEKPIYFLWDYIPIESVKRGGVFNRTYRLRFETLQHLVGNSMGLIRLIPNRIVYSIQEATDYFNELIAEDKEGIVVKNPQMIWKDGTSKNQVKFKVEADCDLQIVAINKGRVGTKNENKAATLTCKTSCRELSVDVTIKNEAMRKSIERNPEDWIDRIVTVRSNRLIVPTTQDGKYSLFLPRLVEAGYRLDKSEADTLKRVREQFDNAIS